MQEYVTYLAIAAAVLFLIWFYYKLFASGIKNKKKWDEYNKESKKLHEEYCNRHLEKVKMYGTPFYPGWDDVQPYLPKLPE